MTIGQLAKATGVNVETVRYYQRRGLVREPRKIPGSRRIYSDDTVQRIAFIHRAQQLGFTLAEVKELIRSSDMADGKAAQIAERRYEKLAEDVRRLREMCRRLKALIRKARAFKGSGPGPIIDALSRP